MVAAFKGFAAVTAALIAHVKVDVNTCDDVRQPIALYFAADQSLQRLRTPLIIACERGHAEIVQQLVSSGRMTNVNARDNLDQSALLRAVSYDYGDIVRMLLQDERVEVNGRYHVSAALCC